MGGSSPHLVQYQGSKRTLAPKILAHMPNHVDRLVEPFCGVCAVTIAAAQAGIAESYWINDLNEPLLNVMHECIENPDHLADLYSVIWAAQFDGDGDHIKHYLKIRDEYNSGQRDPGRTLYLLARCVKGAVRYKSDGTMNQSCDKRRHGTKPETIRKSAKRISSLLKGKTKFTSYDYKSVFSNCNDEDLLYLDPPYQGTSFVRDSRYLAGVSRDELEDELRRLNSRNIGWLLSYDGVCGTKQYGRDLPNDMATKYILDAGRSSQATLLGRNEETHEALYVSPEVDEEYCRQREDRDELR